MPHVVKTQVTRVHHSSKINIISQIGRFFELVIGIKGFGEVIRSTANTCVREDVIDAAM